MGQASGSGESGAHLRAPGAAALLLEASAICHTRTHIQSPHKRRRFTDLFTDSFRRALGSGPLIYSEVAA